MLAVMPTKAAGPAMLVLMLVLLVGSVTLTAADCPDANIQCRIPFSDVANMVSPPHGCNQLMQTLLEAFSITTLLAIADNL